MTEEIRHVRDDEVTTYFHMAAQAFRAPAPRARRNRQWTEAKELRAIYSNGTMMAGLKLINIPIWFGPTTLPHAGITGVASPPENRRKGYIGRLLYATLAELKESGVPLSTLYPFSYEFYRRYGWEHVSDNYVYKLPPAHLPAAKITGTWEALSRSTDFDKETPDPLTAEQMALLKGVYDAWCVGRIGPFARTDRWWRRGPLQEGAELRPDIYLWRDAQGRPMAFVTYQFEDVPNSWRHNLAVWNLTAEDGEAFRAALDFLRNHDSQAEEIKLTLSTDIPLLAMLDNPEVHAEVEARFMLRVVDVESALLMRPYAPDVEAKLTLQVSDLVCEWNNGIYMLEVSGGKGTVTRTTSGTAQLLMDEKALARLYASYLTASQLATVGTITATDPNALHTAGRIFSGPQPFLPDAF